LKSRKTADFTTRQFRLPALCIRIGKTDGEHRLAEIDTVAGNQRQRRKCSGHFEQGDVPVGIRLYQFSVKQSALGTHLYACGVVYNVKTGEQISIVRDKKSGTNPLGPGFRISDLLLVTF
jgi:hypothetical protein